MATMCGTSVTLTPEQFVGAGANVLSFGRFQNAEGFATALACEAGAGDAGGFRLQAAGCRLQASGLGVVLSTVALALDQNGLDVVHQAVQQG